MCIRAVVMEHGFDHRYRFTGHVITGVGSECQQNDGHLVAAIIGINLALVAQLMSTPIIGLPELLAGMKARTVPR